MRSSVQKSQSRWMILTALLVLTTILVFAGFAHAEDGDTAPVKKSAGAGELIVHIVKSAGPVFGPMLAIVSVCLVALIVLLALDLRMSSAIPPGFVEEFTDTVNKRQFKQAFDMAKADNSFLGRVLTAGMTRLQYGLEDAREASLNMLTSIKAGKSATNGYLGVIGTLGPLVGLVGTV